MKSPRFLVLTLLLLLATGVVYSRADTDRVPPSTPLDQLPKTIDSRSSNEIPISPDTLRLLGSGSFLHRIYRGTTPSGLPDDANAIGLFIGYFPTQRTGQAIHSPQNCLPGAGWTFLSSRKISLNGMEGDVGEYVITDGTAKQLVLYWYRSHGRSIASDYAAKAYMMADAIRYNRTDGALIRVITPMREQESMEAAHDRATQFASQLVTLLPEYIPN
ncbi:exosortase C-terminal domain/associated protein EpsI [Terriglobus saanensis]|uniref:EpsI family protein n=1 Tax=Terriglobus saanensis (strain ATCC BAA-1853 / DSM 23119 / SP1PR4) TaxID=401053 RepID=E8V4M0_TERSS|nr:exosortase C-terminal domain/associated protein EpsI [Terriglobus saanensis]ADV81424.1 EpsI family protein [Terriglobus saanensis SP1PR4]